MKTSKILITAFLFIIAVSIVFAANDKVEKVEKNMTKNMTYGNCVSAGAELKNVCYKTAKETKNTCIEQSKNSTTTKDATKTCKLDYTKSMKQCKTEFKSVKNECKKIKHNFFETIGSSMK